MTEHVHVHTRVLFSMLCKHGLGIDTGALPEREQGRQKQVIQRLLRDYPPEEVHKAIKYGMPNVWPFSEDGLPFDAVDLRDNIVQAIAAAGRQDRSGRMPVDVSKQLGGDQ